MQPKIKVSYKQLKWLDSRNRETKDLLLDNTGLYVEMSGNSKIKGLRTTRKVYLPK